MQIDQGCDAPFPGVVYSHEASAKTTAALERWPKQLKAAVTATAAEWRIRYQGEKAKGQVCEDSKEKLHQVAVEALKSKDDGLPRWLVAGLSFIGGAVIVGGAVALGAGVAK